MSWATPGRPGYPKPLLPSWNSWFLSQIFAHQAQRPWGETRTYATTINTGTRDPKIQDENAVLRNSDQQSVSVSLGNFTAFSVNFGSTLRMNNLSRIKMILRSNCHFVLMTLSKAFACLSSFVVKLSEAWQGKRHVCQHKKAVPVDWRIQTIDKNTRTNSKEMKGC